jgi:hypothetical protein
LDGLPFHSIRQDNAIWVERAFEEREVVDVVKELNGYIGRLVQKVFLWLSSSLEFHEFGKFARSLNTTFISLISKKVGAVEIKDFRPINLISGV